MRVVPERDWPFVGRAAELAMVDELLAVGRPVVLAGRAGVGKSRLLHMALDRRAAAGVQVVRATATSAAREIPLGAFAHLLDLGALAGRPDPEGLVEALSAAVRRVDAGTDGLIGVDDAHLLDGPSAVLVRALVDGARCRVVLGVRRGEPLPDPVAGLVRDGTSGVIEVHELAEPELADLLDEVLGPQVDRAVTRRLWATTRGHPLFARELVGALCRSGALRREDGWWRWDGTVPPSATLPGLLDDRVGRLDEALRRALDAVALGEPLALVLAEQVVGHAALEQLEAEGLIAVTGAPEQPVVATAHPLMGEAARAALPVTRARRIRRSLADALDERGVRTEDEALRSAVWRLDGGGAPDADLAVRAARSAWVAGDPALAERLARSAIGLPGDGEARYLLGEALADGGRFAEALATWTSISADDPADLRVSALRARCQAIGLALGRPDEARVLLDTSLAGDPELDCEELRAVRTTLVTLAAGPAVAAADAVAPAGAGPESDAAELMVLLSTLAIDLLAGRTTEVARHLPRAVELAGREARAMPDAILWTGVLGFFVDYFEGRFGQAEGIARRRLDAALGTASLARTLWTDALGLVVLQRGAAREAAALLEEGVALHRADGRTMTRGTLDALAMARATAGDAAGARQALSEAQGLGSRVFDPVAALRAETWVLAAEGALGQAAETARRCAAEERTSGRAVLEVAALHDAARLGDARIVVDRLTEVAASIDGPYVRVVVDHVTGLATADRGRLAGAAAELETMGADLLAAEAWNAAAESAGRAGLAAEAHRFAEHRDAARSRCGTISTPGLLSQPWVDPLSRREREVALLVAGGATDREVAERLVVSVRTVHAHLRSVYAKLGVGGRSDLAGALDGGDRAGPPQPA